MPVTLSLKDKKDIARLTAQCLREMETRELERPVTAKGAAEILGWKIRTVYARVEKLGGWKSGGTLYFRPSVLLRLIYDGAL